jgi:hypothetical protein
MIRITTKCKNCNDTFPSEYPVVPDVGNMIVSAEEKFYEVSNFYFTTSPLGVAEIIMEVVPLKSKLVCG